MSCRGGNNQIDGFNLEVQRGSIKVQLIEAEPGNKWR